MPQITDALGARAESLRQRCNALTAYKLRPTGLCIETNKPWPQAAQIQAADDPPLLQSWWARFMKKEMSSISLLTLSFDVSFHKEFDFEGLRS